MSVSEIGNQTFVTVKVVSVENLESGKSYYVTAQQSTTERTAVKIGPTCIFNEKFRFPIEFYSQPFTFEVKE